MKTTLTQLKYGQPKESRKDNKVFPKIPLNYLFLDKSVSQNEEENNDDGYKKYTEYYDGNKYTFALNFADGERAEVMERRLQVGGLPKDFKINGKSLDEILYIMLYNPFDLPQPEGSGGGGGGGISDLTWKRVETITNIKEIDF